MSQATPSANTSGQIRRNIASRGLAPAGIGYDLAVSARPTTLGGSVRQLPRQGIDDERAQKESFIDITNESTDEEDDSESEKFNLADEDDTAPATDEESDEGSSHSCPLENNAISDPIRIAEEFAENFPPDQPRVYKVGRRYKSYLHDLYIDTANEDAERHSRDGLETLFRL